jgi:tetratricopeptide (TPR) repeat protein
MTIPRLISSTAKIGLCLAGLLASACSNQWEVRRAAEAYEKALANNDPIAQRNALLALTKADEDESDYWIRLAKLELELGMYGAAYQHFARAHEIDRTAVYPLSVMTELAVLNGRLDYANDHLKELMVLAPDDHAVAVARGFTALSQANFALAQQNATILLAQNAGDPIGNLLQTRILVTQRKIPEAIDLLERRLGAGAEDPASLRSLAAIYRYLGQWNKAARIDLKLWKSRFRDPDSARQVVFDALKANDRALAYAVTKRVLIDAKAKDELDNVLSVWANHAPSDTSLSGALPASAPDITKIAFAHYLNQVGRADQALAVLGGNARSLEDRENVPFNAVFAESLGARGDARLAKRILDGVLANEPDNAIALSARARLLSSLGDHRKATLDAQRLATSFPTNPEYRLLLASVYRASGDNRAAERTLWDGYRDLPLAESLYEEVKQVLTSRNDGEGVVELERAYNDKRFSQLLKELA